MTELSHLEAEILDQLIERVLKKRASGEYPPFSAAIVLDGKCIAICDNTTDKDGDPTRHAEMNAISTACRELSGADLSDCTLISSFQPCEMCLTSAVWAGIRRIIYAAGRETNSEFFKFPGLTLHDFKSASSDPLTLIGPVAAEKTAPAYRPN